MNNVNCINVMFSIVLRRENDDQMNNIPIILLLSHFKITNLKIDAIFGIQQWQGFSQ